jgi:hypothetical protein
MDKEVIIKTQKTILKSMVDTLLKYLLQMVLRLMSMTFSNRRISNLQNLLITNKLNHVRSTIPLPFSADRAGVHLAIIEIDFQITQRNDIDKSYSLVAIDYTINDHITIAIRNSMPESMRLQYIDSPGRRDWKKKLH